MIRELLGQVSPQRLQRDLFHLCADPLPFRKANYTRPGQTVDSLKEADQFISGQLEEAGYQVQSTQHRVQAFRCDETKPLHHWYSRPEPEDPWYEVANLEVVHKGSEHPEQFIQLVSHKDSMSWIDSPGAYDNCAGTIVHLELARLLASAPTKHSIRMLFCNEEHVPWTSRHAAEVARARGDDLIAVLNIDSVGGIADEDRAAGRRPHVVTYSTDEGRPLAEFMVGCAQRYAIDLEGQVVFKERINDDDGMFINAGYRRTVMHIGSFPYADAHYHLPEDVAQRVDIDHLAASAQLVLAGVLALDTCGVEGLPAE